MEARSQLRHRPTKDYLIFMEGKPFVKPPQLRFSLPAKAFCLPWQPRLRARHRAAHMFLAQASTLLLLAVCACSAGAQGAAPAAAAPPRLVPPGLRAAASQINQTLADLSIRHWKAPNQVRDVTQEDVDSIQRDFSGTLLGLLDRADAEPDSIPAAFAVYRNVDALYDTLLRVVLTANLTAPDNEVRSLDSDLNNLEDIRTSLGESILSAAQTQQAEFVRMRSVIAAAAAAAARRPPMKTTVIDDGPIKEPEVKHHHTTRKPSKPADSKTGKPTPQ
jgi:hypothetical protein